MALVDRVDVSTTLTPKVSVPVSSPTPTTPLEKTSAAILRLLKPTITVYLEGSPLPIAPWGQSEGSWLPLIGIAGGLFLVGAGAGYFLGRVTK